MAGRGHGGHGHGPMSTERAKDFKGTMKKLMAYLGNYKIAIAFVMIFAIGSTIFNIVGPKILGKATTEIFNGLVGKISGGAGIDFTAIGKILTMLLFTKCGIFLYSRVYYDRDITEINLSDAKRDFGED